MRKLFRKIHLWLAIPLGLIIFVICLTGAILVFETELNEMAHPGRYFVKEVPGEPLPLGQLAAIVDAKLTDDKVASIQAPSDPKRCYIARLSGRASAYVNPYTGDITFTTKRGEGFFGKVMQLHRWLLHREVGKPVVGYTTLFFVVILIAGMVIWWPRSKKQMKPRFRIKTKSGWRRFWYDMHSTAGMYVFIGLLVLALTGLTYSFQWYSKGFYKVFGVELAERRGGNQQPARREQTNKSEERQGRGEGRQDRGERDGNNMLQWQAVLDKLKADNPDYRNISIQDGSATVARKFVFGNVRASDKYTFDPHTGEITDIQLYKDQERAVKVRGWIYTLHVGAWGSLFSKIITCLISLVGASLPITGYYLFIKKHRKRR